MNRNIFVKGKIKFASNLINIFEKYQGIELLNNLNEMFDIGDIKGSFIDINAIDISEFPYNWTNINTLDINNKSFEFSYCIQSDLIYIIEYFERLLSIISVDFSFFEISFKDTVIEYTLERNKLFKKNENHQFIYKLINIDEKTYFKCYPTNIKSEENKFLAKNLLKFEIIFRKESLSGNFMTNKELIDEWLLNTTCTKVEESTEEEYLNENNSAIEINLFDPKDEKLFFSNEESFFNTLYEMGTPNDIQSGKKSLQKTSLFALSFITFTPLIIKYIITIPSMFVKIAAYVLLAFICLLTVTCCYYYIKYIKRIKDKKTYEMIKILMNGDDCFNGK